MVLSTQPTTEAIIERTHNRLGHIIRRIDNILLSDTPDREELEALKHKLWVIKTDLWNTLQQ